MAIILLMQQLIGYVQHFVILDGPTIIQGHVLLRNLNVLIILLLIA